MRIPVSLLVVLFCGLMQAQDADTIVLKNDSQKFTIISQIEDPAEAAAFLSIVSAKDAAARYECAAEFVKKYPQSWLLAQAYDLSARSAIDLDKYDQALADGLFSLRLLPENPSLLILVANMEARKNQLLQAKNHASQALEYLNFIERTPNMSQTEWNAVRPGLKSSAYFARGRAEASQALAAGAPEMLKDALNDLNSAAAWNPEDSEVFYLRAIVEIKLDQKTAAASDLAFVYGNGSPLRQKAQSILGMLSKMPLDQFVKTLPARAIDTGLRKAEQATESRAGVYGYAGPEACQGCHEKEYTAWRKTGMARMLQPYRAENIIGDFSAAAKYSEGVQCDPLRRCIETVFRTAKPRHMESLLCRLHHRFKMAASVRHETRRRTNASASN